MAQKKKKQ